MNGKLFNPYTDEDEAKSNFLTLYFFTSSKMLKKPTSFVKIYFSGYFKEYCTPAYAAKFTTLLILFFLNIKFRFLKSDISNLINLKYLLCFNICNLFILRDLS